MSCQTIEQFLQKMFLGNSFLVISGFCLRTFLSCHFCPASLTLRHELWPPLRQPGLQLLHELLLCSQKNFGRSIIHHWSLFSPFGGNDSAHGSLDPQKRLWNNFQADKFQSVTHLNFRKGAHFWQHYTLHWRCVTWWFQVYVVWFREKLFYVQGKVKIMSSRGLGLIKRLKFFFWLPVSWSHPNLKFGWLKVDWKVKPWVSPFLWCWTQEHVSGLQWHHWEPDIKHKNAQNMKHISPRNAACRMSEELYTFSWRVRSHWSKWINIRSYFCRVYLGQIHVLLSC